MNNNVPEGDSAPWREAVKLHLLVVTANWTNGDHLAVVHLDVFAHDTTEVGQAIDELRVALVLAGRRQLQRLCLKDYLVNLACNRKRKKAASELTV